MFIFWDWSTKFQRGKLVSITDFQTKFVCIWKIIAGEIFFFFRNALRIFIAQKRVELSYSISFSLSSQKFTNVISVFNSTFKRSLQWSIARFTDPSEIKFQARVIADLKWSRLRILLPVHPLFHDAPDKVIHWVQIRAPWNTLNATLFSFS